MRLLVPAALLFALLALPILLLYMLKLRRTETPVSSILLWERLLRDRQANAPWQRIRRNLLLLLQLLILAALVFAPARPALLVPSPFAGSVVVLLDASASMNAADVSPNRFEAARARVADLIRDLPGGARMTLILAGSQAEILIANSGDRPELRAALQRAEVSQGPADWQAAFALAASAAATPSEEGEEPAVVLVSDGGLPQEGLPGLPGEARYLQVGESGENLALAAFALRPSPSGGELFARAVNYGGETRRALLSFYAGGQLFQAQELTLPPGESAGVTARELPAGATQFSARLSPPAGEEEPLDLLPLDDSAYTVSQAGETRRALLATRGNLFLEQFFAAVPGLEAFRILPGESGELELPGAGQEGPPYDLYIFDGLLPPELPQASLLLVNPPDGPFLEVGEYFTRTAPARAAEHPLARFVEWDSVSVLRARTIALPDWAEPLVSAPGGPLVFAGESAGRRAAVLSFDLHESDLPLQVAYPILLSNLTAYLLRDGGAGDLAAGESLRPGDSLSIPPAIAAGGLTITTPSGQSLPLQAGESGFVFTGTDEIGIYRAFAEGGGPDAPAAGAFAVNLFAPEESDLRPRERISLGGAALEASAQSEVGQRELWPLIAAAGLVLLLLEWWVYQRGSLLPARWRRKAEARE